MTLVPFDHLRIRPRAALFEGERFGASVSCFVVESLPGEGAPLHVHPYEEVFVLLAGEAVFTVGDAEVRASAEQVVVAPAGVPHAYRSVGAEPLQFVGIHPRGVTETRWLDPADP